MKKIQLPAIGGIRKTIKIPDQTTAVGTTIAEFGSQIVTLQQLQAALGLLNQNGTGVNIIQPGSGNDNVIQTLWRLAPIIWGGFPHEIFGGVLGLDGGAASDVFTGLQTLDCEADRVVTP
jgi:hypothetical protein